MNIIQWAFWWSDFGVNCIICSLILMLHTGEDTGSALLRNAGICFYCSLPRTAINDS